VSPEIATKIKMWLAEISECWPEAPAIAFQAEALLEEIAADESLIHQT